MLSEHKCLYAQNIVFFLRGLTFIELYLSFLEVFQHLQQWRTTPCSALVLLSLHCTASFLFLVFFRLSSVPSLCSFAIIPSALYCLSCEILIVKLWDSLLLCWYTHCVKHDPPVYPYLLLSLMYTLFLFWCACVTFSDPGMSQWNRKSVLTPKSCHVSVRLYVFVC